MNSKGLKTKSVLIKTLNEKGSFKKDLKKTTFYGKDEKGAEKEYVYYDIRLYFKEESGEYRPTTKGVMFTPAEMEGLREPMTNGIFYDLGQTIGRRITFSQDEERDFLYNLQLDNAKKNKVTKIQLTKSEIMTVFENKFE